MRREGGRDALWRVAPTDGAATKLVDLAFRPSRIEASPDGARLALLPTAIGPKVYVCDVANATVKALSLAARGVRSVDSFTWLSSTRLLVAGSPRATRVAYPMSDRLYSLNVVSGVSASFRDLRGTEPSAAPAAARLVYVRLADAGPAPSEPGSRLISEKLVSLKLASGTTPRVIARARYSGSYDIRRFRDPRVSPRGRFVITSTTGSDVSVSYMVRWVTTGNALFTKATTLAGRDATGWRPLGSKGRFLGHAARGFDDDHAPLRLRHLGAQAQLGRAVLEGGSHQALVVARRDADQLRSAQPHGRERRSYPVDGRSGGCDFGRPARRREPAGVAALT